MFNTTSHSYRGLVPHRFPTVVIPGTPFATLVGLDRAAMTALVLPEQILQSYAFAQSNTEGHCSRQLVPNMIIRA